jgi:DNA-binding NarL/FixJ family response regulator
MLDRLAGEGVHGYLRSAAGIRLAPHNQPQIADVTVVVTTELTEQLLGRIKQAHEVSVAAGHCVALIAGPATERYMALAFRYGAVSMLPRTAASREAVISMVLASGHGSAMLSGPAVRWLADTSRNFADIAYTTHGITAGGLTAREVDVVRLLAVGLPTNEIAARLNYAERTIKNTIRDMLDRHHLRNRAHAVAYAHRTGAI